MLRLENKYFSQAFTYSIWLLMAFQAGYINVGGFFTSGNFVSHVTGTSSRLGMGMAQMDWKVLLTFGTILLAFIGGAAFAGHYIGQYKDAGKNPRYVFVLSTKSFFFGLILLLSSDYSPLNGGVLAQYVNWLIIFFLSFCCGIQNSTCTLSSNGKLRPTHMTGLSTDIGLFLVKLFSKKRQTPEFKEVLNEVLIKISILLSFIFGGVIATFIFSDNGHYGFLFPFISSICFLMMAIIRDIKKMEIESLAFRTAQGSIFAIFITTLLFGLNSYLNEF